MIPLRGWWRHRQLRQNRQKLRRAHSRSACDSRVAFSATMSSGRGPSLTSVPCSSRNCSSVRRSSCRPPRLRPTSPPPTSPSPPALGVPTLGSSSWPRRAWRTALPRFWRRPPSIGVPPPRLPPIAIAYSSMSIPTVQSGLCTPSPPPPTIRHSHFPPRIFSARRNSWPKKRTRRRSSPYPPRSSPFWSWFRTIPPRARRFASRADRHFHWLHRARPGTPRPCC
mmetsp:Transcript_1664/g.3321  ORF Transcript_1664/g.3321 Transcript_1664/m.3321 type:complete len:224 (+) Transcript_1664:519-1190(+)